MIKTKQMQYQDNNVTFEGYYAYDDDNNEKKPVILVVHDWSGRNAFAEKKAEQLAALGYVGFAVDMYGSGKTGNTKEEKAALMHPLINDRSMIRSRMLAAYETVKKLPITDPQRIGAMGFCFGGLCALDLARSGAQLRGVVSLHGALTPLKELMPQPILAKVLVLHGYEDPSVLPAQVQAFEKEMTEAHVDWQVHVYGQTMHAFTNPLANDLASGLVYNQKADKRAWIATQNFFEEVMS